MRRVRFCFLFRREARGEVCRGNVSARGRRRDATLRDATPKKPNERWLENRLGGVSEDPTPARTWRAGRRTCEGEQRAGARHVAVGVGEREVRRLRAWEDGGGEPSGAPTGADDSRHPRETFPGLRDAPPPAAHPRAYLERIEQRIRGRETDPHARPLDVGHDV